MSEDDRSGRLGLPYLLPAQAQKHVTHNEALQLLDALVQLVITGFGAEIPPTDPAPGEVHALGPAPAGAWEGQAGMLACQGNGDWLFVAPAEGWLAHDLAGGGLRVFRDGDWWPFWQGVPQLGVNAAADAVNRLAVAGPATLLTHTGAGHQLKLNKAAAADTASLLFQTGWAGRAEMGLVASDDFVIKVSADGTAFHTALSIARVSGHVTAPAGLGLADGTAAQPGVRFAADEDTGIRRSGSNALALVTGGTDRLKLSGSGAELTGLLTGTAVVQSSNDTTAGRLVTPGWMGLGAATPIGLTDLDDPSLPTGFYRATTGLGVGTFPPGMSGNTCIVQVHSYASGSVVQRMRRATAAYGTWERHYAGGSWSPWRQVQPSQIVGTVSQTGGVPTGALIERGSNTNGEFTRYADGTQECFAVIEIKPAGDATTGNKSKTWTYPAGFVSGTTKVVVTHSVVSTNAELRGRNTVNNPSNTGIDLIYFEGGGNSPATLTHARAIGRWFNP